MMKTSDFCDKWDSFKGQKECVQRVNPDHPLDFFVGISPNGYEELILFSKTEPARLVSSKALIVEKNPRKDGRWATQIYSVDEENKDIFARLCVDLVECSQYCTNELDGLSKVTKRYLAWYRLFAKLKETLPINVLKGLIGELTFARDLLDKGFNKDDVVVSWLGPDGADRDFVISDTWFENKAISTGKNTISISSLNQLETDDEGYLTVVNIDESSCTDLKAVSVKGYIDLFRNILSDAPAAATLFEQKLVSIGYIDKNAYENIYFVIGDRSFYKVDGSFPKLTTSSVPSEITDVKYDLSISGIQPWKTGEDQIWN